MREFFRGWRRKAGCLTLVLACVLAAGWIRSYAHIDNLLLITDQTLNGVLSINGATTWGTNWMTDGSKQQFDTWLKWKTAPVTPLMNVSTPDGTTYHWKYSLGGFQLYRYDWSRFNQSGMACTLPYWSIVIPLTLLSAWLLLSKQREAVSTARGEAT